MKIYKKLNPEEVREMLHYIDAVALSYDQWVNIGMALNSEFPGADGLGLWEEWSARDPERFKEGECERKWRGFNPGGGITIATLIEEAQEGGYKSRQTSHALSWDGYVQRDEPINGDREYDWDEVVPVNDDITLTEQQVAAARKPKEIPKKTRKVGQEKKDKEPDEETKRMIAAIEARIGKKEANPTNVFKGKIEQAIKDREGSPYNAYMNFRGFTDEDQEVLHTDEYAPYFGYVKNVKYYHKNKDGTGEWRVMKNGLLIAETYDGYTIRNMEAKDEDRYLNGSKEKEGNIVVPTGITAVAANPHKRNKETGYPEPVFIVEGYIDSPSIYVTGTNAIALNGVSNFNRLVYCLSYFDVTRPLILALDDDSEKEKNTGKKRQRDLAKALDEAGFEYYEIPELYKGYNDANEFFSKARASFQRALQEATDTVFSQINEELSFNVSQQKEFEEELLRRHLNPAIPTGFEILDSTFYLGGGLRPALYVMGAVSSLGKTTFALQIADTIAKSGQDVIFFSLEMSKYELMGKSVSRYTFAGDREPQSLLDIYRRFLKNPGLSISQSIAEYFKDTGQHLRILEGFAETDVKRIRREVIRHINRTGRRPVIFIDYLQILLPPSDPFTKRRQNMTDKQKNDYNITELKRLSRDLDVPVFVISSFNRENYNTPVNMASFKETGGIEYSSDVLMGLQHSYMMVKDATDKEKLKDKYYERWEETQTRIVNLSILKNRYGDKNKSIMYLYKPAYNYFEESMSGKDYLESLGIERKKWPKKKKTKATKAKTISYKDLKQS